MTEEETSDLVGELRSALVTLAKAHEQHERRLTAIETQLDACRLSAQTATRGVIELQEREHALVARVDAVEAANEAFRIELGHKVDSTTVEALVKLKADRKVSEQQIHDASEARGVLKERVEALTAEVEQLTRQVHTTFHDGDQQSDTPQEDEQQREAQQQPRAPRNSWAASGRTSPPQEESPQLGHAVSRHGPAGSRSCGGSRPSSAAARHLLGEQAAAGDFDSRVVGSAPGEEPCAQPTDSRASAAAGMEQQRTQQQAQHPELASATDGAAAPDGVAARRRPGSACASSQPQRAPQCRVGSAGSSRGGGSGAPVSGGVRCSRPQSARATTCAAYPPPSCFANGAQSQMVMMPRSSPPPSPLSHFGPPRFANPFHTDAALSIVTLGGGSGLSGHKKNKPFPCGGPPPSTTPQFMPAGAGIGGFRRPRIANELEVAPNQELVMLKSDQTKLRGVLAAQLGRVAGGWSRAASCFRVHNQGMPCLGTA